MTLLPIVERELRAAARRRSTFWLRLLVASGVILMATWILMLTRLESQREVGKVMFSALTGGLLLYCLLAGVRSTADCLSEEKREGTLGLLFLTDLRGYDVVLGKLAANSLPVFYGVLAVVPVLAIPLLLGGVSGGEFWRVALVLVNTLFLSLSAGMLASAVCRKQRSAIGLTLFLILLVVAGGPLLGLSLAWKQHLNFRYDFVFLVPSPVYSYFAAFDKMIPRVGGSGFFWSVGFDHCLSWLFLFVASAIVPRSWQDKAVGTRGWRGPMSAIFKGEATLRRNVRGELLDRNAYFWLATRPRWRVVWAWVPLVLAAWIWGWGLYQLGNDWLDVGIYVATAILLGTTMKVCVGAEAGRQLIEDRKSGALELLLSTPLSVPDVLRGQRLALQRQFLWPVLVLLGAAGLMAAAGANSSTLNSGERSYWYWSWLAGLIMFGADVTALYWLGMWTGLSVRNTKHAFGAAVMPVLGLPWIGIAMVVTVVNLLPREAQHMFDWDGWAVLLWFGFGIAVDIGFGFWARNKLLQEFRLRATQRFEPGGSWWRRLLANSGV